jgi:hypothetical protein
MHMVDNGQPESDSYRAYKRRQVPLPSPPCHPSRTPTAFRSSWPSGSANSTASARSWPITGSQVFRSLSRRLPTLVVAVPTPATAPAQPVSRALARAGDLLPALDAAVPPPCSTCRSSPSCQFGVLEGELRTQVNFYKARESQPLLLSPPHLHNA